MLCLSPVLPSFATNATRLTCLSRDVPSGYGRTAGRNRAAVLRSRGARSRRGRWRPAAKPIAPPIPAAPLERPGQCSMGHDKRSAGKAIADSRPGDCFHHATLVAGTPLAMTGTVSVLEHGGPRHGRPAMASGLESSSVGKAISYPARRNHPRRRFIIGACGMRLFRLAGRVMPSLAPTTRRDGGLWSGAMPVPSW